MIAIGNGEECPFCKGEHTFINHVDNDFLQHCLEYHEEEFSKALFGGKIGSVNSDDGEKEYKYTCAQCGDGTDRGYYNYYAGDSDDNILCENGDCWSEWMQDNTYEVSDEI